MQNVIIVICVIIYVQPMKLSSKPSRKRSLIATH